VLIVAALIALTASTQDPAAYPTFRGANRDGHSPDKGLLRQWPTGGPKLAWKASGLGAGYAGVSAYGGKLYTLADLGDDCALVCLDAADGKTLWTTKFGTTFRMKRDVTWDNNRATPTTDGKIVIALGASGELLCADAATGKEIWKKHMKGDFEGKVGNWSYSESPTIDGDHVVCVPGGSKGAVLALKKTDGSPVWRSTEFTDKAEYASLVPSEIGGVRQYLVYTMNTVAGIAAKDGKLLWSIARPEGRTAVIPTPIVKGDLVFACSGYGVGENAYRVTSSGGMFKATEIYSGKKMQNHHGGVILVGDHLYGIADGNSLRCIELSSGKVVWEQKCPKGSLGFADGLLIARAERGNPEVILIEASPAGYKELGKFVQPEPSTFPKWPHPTIYGGKLYLRDWDKLFAYEVK
jgi:outer membrane protein assembly factor BamB